MKKYVALFSLMFVAFLFHSSPAVAGGKEDAKKVVDYAKSHSWAAQPGYKGGTEFQNREGKLPLASDPLHNDKKAKVTYKEYDVNPLVKGKNRGTERVVICFKDGAFHKAYYTDDHYSSFTEI